MPKKVKELSAKQIRDFTKKGLLAVGGVAGLYLQVSSPASKSWILRATIGGKRRDMGLGGYPDVSLSQARESAREVKLLIKDGIDPIQQRQEQRQLLIKTQNKKITFAAIVKLCHEKKSKEFKNKKHAAQWLKTLETYAFPTLGTLSIDEIEVSDVLKVLEPIWETKTETANRVRQRIAAVFDYALAADIRTKRNPADWKGCLEPLLATPDKIKERQKKKDKHHPAIAVSEIASFVSDLALSNGSSAKVLLFIILTAARSGEGRGARLSEIDFDRKIWEVPKDRMKGNLLHKVPLSDAAVELITSVKRNNSPMLFPGQCADRGISDTAINKLIKRIQKQKSVIRKDYYCDAASGRVATSHGFRSTFKEWARSKPEYPDEWSELALAHVNGDKTRAAYARSQLVNERAQLMQDWADFVMGRDLSHS